MRCVVLAKNNITKCPKCGIEKEVSRMLGSESAEGNCDDFKIHFVTATYWQELSSEWKRIKNDVYLQKRSLINQREIGGVSGE